MMSKLIGSAVGLALTMAGHTAFAQSVNEAFQIGIGTSLLARSDVMLEGDTGVDTEVEVETTQYGVHGDSGVTLLLGYGLSDAFVVGGYLQLGGQDVDTTTTVGAVSVGTGDETTAFSLGPRVDYMFLDGAVRPYVGASFGYLSLTQDDGTNELDLGGFEVGAAVGLRWFPAPGLSIDPSLFFEYFSASGEIDPDGAAASTDIDASGTAYGLGLSISGWL